MKQREGVRSRVLEVYIDRGRVREQAEKGKEKVGEGKSGSTLAGCFW